MWRTLTSVSQSSSSLAPVWKHHPCIVLVGFCSHWSFGIFRRISWSSCGSWVEDGAHLAQAQVTHWYSVSPAPVSKLALIVDVLPPAPSMSLTVRPCDNSGNTNVSLHFQVAAPGLTPAPPFAPFDPTDWPERLLSSRSAFSLCACSSSYLVTDRRLSTCAHVFPLPRF